MPSSPRDRDPAVLVEGVVKRFGATTALDHVDLQVPAGSVLALLGPNGAGKTTLVRVLATLLRPDAGRALVFGHDVAHEAGAVRRRIGLTGQFAAVDDLLTGRENLRMFGRLSHLTRREAGRRADELLDAFGLADAGDRPVRTYSGGMRRRLDLASGLIGRPQMLFLDEPTTGLDPASRSAMWQVIEDLVGQGMTLLLTTQYLDEADRLADRIAVIDHGGIVAEGTGDQLKERVGGQRVELRLADAGDGERAESALAALGQRPDRAGVRLSVPVSDDGVATVAAVATALRDAGITVVDLALRRPTLDDVFLQLTGAPAAPLPAGEEVAA